VLEGWLTSKAEGAYAAVQEKQARVWLTSKAKGAYAAVQERQAGVWPFISLCVSLFNIISFVVTAPVSLPLIISTSSHYFPSRMVPSLHLR
jgi:hypothetical protein